MKKLLLLAMMAICILACQSQTGTIKIIPVNIHEDSPVKLSEITEEIKKISLELTDDDESLIGIITKVIYRDDRLIIYDGGKTSKVLLFDSEGKYIRQIGRRGQGPGEYNGINDIAYDKSEHIIFIATYGKILCYNTEGVFLHECKTHSPEYIYFQDGYMNLFSTRFGVKVEDGYLNQTTLYRMDRKCNQVDSIIVKSVILNRLSGATFPQMDYMSEVNSQTFLYYPVLTAESIVRDTLYELKERIMIPFLKLRFSDERATSSSGNKTKNLTNIWRSERFVIANYQNKDGNFCFMHDLKTGHSANMRDGFDDDIHHSGKVNIRPLGENYFYYIFTPGLTDENLKEEPNPDIYIGKLL